MTFATEAATSGAREWQWIEVALDRCQLTYGSAPCTAAIGVTGTDKCYNGFKHCQDPDNFDPAPYFVRFCEPIADIPLDFPFTDDGVTHFVPLLQSISHSPVRPEPGAKIGVKASITIELTDAPHHDIGIDKYFSDRAFDPITRSLMLLKMRTRFPNYIGRTIRWYRGFLTDSPAYSDFEMREYVVEKMEGPDRNGRVTLTAKDPLKLADNDRAQAPVASNGTLATEIADSGPVTTIDILTDDATEYDAGSIVFVGDEGFQYSGTTPITGGVQLTGVSRGLPSPYETSTSGHSVGDTVQMALYYDQQEAHDIVYDLLTNYVPGWQAAWITKADWDDEFDTWLRGLKLTRIISEPEGVEDLINEIISQNLIWGFWWDEASQKVRARVIRPLDEAGGESAFVLTDDRNLVAGTVDRFDKPDLIVNEVQLIYGQIDPVQKRDERDNYRAVHVEIDVDSQSSLEIGQRRLYRVFSRWHTAGNSAFVSQYGRRLLSMKKANSFTIEFGLTRKDSEDIKLGEYADITTQWLIDELGLPATTRVQIMRSDQGGQVVTYQAREDFFASLYGRIAPASLAGTEYADGTETQRNTYAAIGTAGETKYSNGDDIYRIL